MSVIANTEDKGVRSIGESAVNSPDVKDADPANPTATYSYNSFDCLRIQNGKVQEHWDDAQKTAPRPARGN